MRRKDTFAVSLCSGGDQEVDEMTTVQCMKYVPPLCAMDDSLECV